MSDDELAGPESDAEFISKDIIEVISDGRLIGSVWEKDGARAFSPKSTQPLTELDLIEALRVVAGGGTINKT